MAHFSRKCYSTVKQQLQHDAGYSALLLSEMDTVFMATYAAGNIINGKLGDTFNPTTILAIGLWGSGVCLFLINVAIWFDFGGMSRAFGNCFIIGVYFLFGFFQATGGPVGTAVMGNWFCDAESVKNRGTIFGFWTCHQYCGDITAALCTAWVLGMKWPWWWALTIPAATNVAWGFITAQLVADPVNVGIITPEVRIRQAKMEAKRKEMAEQGEIMAEDEGPQPITFLGALQIPMVAQYAFAFGFFKLTNYVLFFWLPYFLGKNFDPVTANLIAALYSVGMMPGGIIVGSVSDLFGGRRAVVIGTFMLTLIVFLGVFAVMSEQGNMSAVLLLVMLGCMGILVGGYVILFTDGCMQKMVILTHSSLSSILCILLQQTQQHHHVGCRCRFGVPPLGPWKQQVFGYRHGSHQRLWFRDRLGGSFGCRSFAGEVWLGFRLDLPHWLHCHGNGSHGYQDLRRALPSSCFYHH